MTGLRWYILEFQFIKLFLEYQSVILGSDTQTYLMETLSIHTETLNLIDLGEESSAKLVHMTKAEQYLLFIMYEVLFIPWVSAMLGPCLDNCSGGFVADMGCAQASSEHFLLRSLIKAPTGLVSKWWCKPQTSWTTYTTTSFSKYNANFSNYKFSAAISSWYHRLNPALFFYPLFLNKIGCTWC